MLTISFLSSSDMEELSISSKAHKIQVIIFVFKIKVNLLLIKVLTLSKYDHSTAATFRQSLPVSYSSSSPILNTGFTPR